MMETIRVSLSLVSHVCLALCFSVRVFPWCVRWNVGVCRVVDGVTGALLQSLFFRADFMSMILLLRFPVRSKTHTHTHLLSLRSLDKLYLSLCWCIFYQLIKNCLFILGSSNRNSISSAELSLSVTIGFVDHCFCEVGQRFVDIS